MVRTLDLDTAWTLQLISTNEMKLVAFIESSKSATQHVVNDNVSMCSSSVYTSREKSSSSRRISTTKERSDERSRMSSSVSPLDHCTIPRTRSTTGDDNVSLYLSEFFENDEYNMLDIEEQLDNISADEAATRSCHPLFESICPGEDILRHQQLQPPAAAMSSSRQYISPNDHEAAVSQEQSIQKFSTKRSLRACSVCILGALVLTLLIVVLAPNRDDVNEAPSVQSRQSATTSDKQNYPTAAPTMIETVEPPSLMPPPSSKHIEFPTASPTPEESIEAQSPTQATDLCRDDTNALIEIGQQEAVNCTWLASQPASQVILCNENYPSFYNVCKATCQNCNDQ